MGGILRGAHNSPFQDLSSVKLKSFTSVALKTVIWRGIDEHLRFFFSVFTFPYEFLWTVGSVQIQIIAALQLVVANCN